MKRVVVIGAGISGLATAWELMTRGEDVTVLEAGERVGGVIGTIERDGFLMETAANGFIDRDPGMRNLIDALGLSERVRPAAPTAKERFVFTRGEVRPVPASPPAMLKSDLLPVSARLRLVAELLSGRGSGEDESLASFARRHIGKRATAVLIDAVQTGIFAGDVERLSVGATFPQMVKLERENRSLILGMIRMQRAQKQNPAPKDPRLSGVLSTFDRGMQTLVDALAAALGGRVRLRTPVRSLKRSADGGWQVELDGAVLEADEVVLATPSPVSAELVASHSEALAVELRAIRYAPIAAVHVAFPKPEEAVRGFGFLVPSEEKRRVLGAMFISSFFPFRTPDAQSLVTVMVGGARNPELVSKQEDELATTVCEELAQTLKVRTEPAFTKVVRWTRGIPQYEVGHLARMERIDAAVKPLKGLHLTGNAYRGVGVLDCVRNARALAEAISPRPTGS